MARTMKVQDRTICETGVAKSLAAEDLRCGDFVSILFETLEFPSFWWGCDPQLVSPSEPVRLQCHSGDGGTPLKIKAICLPFVFVKKPCGEHCTLDVRRHRLARLSLHYARRVWKVMAKRTAAAITA
jgi:hypothetical protein